MFVLLWLFSKYYIVSFLFILVSWGVLDLMVCCSVSVCYSVSVWLCDGFVVILSSQRIPLQPTSHSHVPSPVRPSLQRPFLQSQSAQTTKQSETGRNCYVMWGERGERTLITVDSIFAALACLTGGAVETFVTLTHSGPIRPIQTHSVTEAGLTFGPGTWLTVLPEKPSTTPPHLKTEQTFTFHYLSLCSVFWENEWRTMFSWRQVDLQPMVSSRSSSNIWLSIHFLFFTDFCRQQEVSTGEPNVNITYI